MPCFFGIGDLSFTNQYPCIHYVWLKIRVENSIVKKLKTVKKSVVLQMLLTAGGADGANCCYRQSVDIRYR